MKKTSKKSFRVLVTGGEGFIGSSLCSKLLKRGHEVASFDSKLNFIDNASYSQLCFDLRKKHFHSPKKVYTADIRDTESLSQAIKDFNPEVIVHLAGLPMARVLDQYAHLMVPINLTSTLDLLQLFERSKARRFIFTSSSMTYGHFKQTPQSENFMLDPVNSYGATKAAAEYFVKLSQKEWVIVRPTSVYGFADCANRVTQLLLDAAFMKKPAWVIKGETLDFSYIEDVADGFVACVESSEAVSETFNISRGESRAASEFAEVIQKHFPKFEYELREPSAQQVWRGPLDISKAEKELDFHPKYSIEDGVRETIELMKEYKFYAQLGY